MIPVNITQSIPGSIKNCEFFQNHCHCLCLHWTNLISSICQRCRDCVQMHPRHTLIKVLLQPFLNTHLYSVDNMGEITYSIIAMDEWEDVQFSYLQKLLKALYKLIIQQNRCIMGAIGAFVFFNRHTHERAFVCTHERVFVKTHGGVFRLYLSCALGMW